MNVSVVFNADTGKYESRLEGMDRKTAATAQAVANAKNKIVSYHQEQIASAVKLGKSAEGLGTHPAQVGQVAGQCHRRKRGPRHCGARRVRQKIRSRRRVTGACDT